jgi:hypothetical protein
VPRVAQSLQGGRAGARLVVAAFVVLAVVASGGGASAVAVDAASALTPAPGTGHGVLGSAPSAGESGSLEYSPGLGDACDGKPRQVAVNAFRYGEVFRGPGVVGLPVSLCVGEFPSASMQVRITGPGGADITLRDQVIEADATGVSIQLQVLPAPPTTRYQVIDGAGHTSNGRLTGDGAGSYTVRVRGGGATTTERFTLEPAPAPRLLNLTGMEASVEQGGRLRFGAAGQQPLTTFQVGIFGPYPSGNSALPLRTVVVGRADRKGQAVITLDVLPTSVPGSGYVAVLDPAAPLAHADALDPRVAMFDVTDQPR